MSANEERIAGVMAIFEKLLRKPFPEEEGEPGDDFQWDNFNEFITDAPDRMVETIDYAYCDYENAAEAYDELTKPEEYKEQYQDIYNRCVAMLAAAWGPGNAIDEQRIGLLLSYKSGTAALPADPIDAYYSTPGILIDENRVMIAGDGFHITWWARGGRIALMHYTAEEGAGQVLVTVSACVLPETTDYVRDDDDW